MARACTVRSRVERILAATTAPAKLGWGKRIGTAAVVLPVVLVSAGSIAYRTAPLSSPAQAHAIAPASVVGKAQSVSFYSLGHGSIFTVSREGDEIFGQVSGQRRLRLAAAGDGTYSYPTATGPILVAVRGERQAAGPVLNRDGHDISAIRVAELSSQSVEVDANLPDSYVGAYQLGTGRVLTVTREGERLLALESGRPKFEITARGVDAFVSSRDDLVVFLRDGQSKVIQVLLYEPVYGARLAPRVTAARAKVIEEGFARRIAAAPDRFRDQAPLPGSKEAILRGIDDMQRGAPNYDRMSASLAARIRRQESELQAMFKAFGAVESIFFRGVGPGGYDIYGVKFANGVAEFRILLTADNKADDVIFRPDGDSNPGGILACSEEGSIRATAVTAPIKVLIYNGSGSDIQLFKIDAEGKRVASGTIGEEVTFPVTTYVDSPWVITDRSGKCLEVLLPGQQTRLHTVEGHSLSGGAVLRRTVPLAIRPLKPRNSAFGRFTHCTGKRNGRCVMSPVTSTVSRCAIRVGPTYQGIRVLAVKMLSPSRDTTGMHCTSAIPSPSAMVRYSATIAAKRSASNPTRSILLTASTTWRTPSNARIWLWRRVCVITPLRASINTTARSAADAPVAMFRVYWAWPGVSATTKRRRWVAKKR